MSQMSQTTKSKKALICGVSGQDGAWLARLLLGKGYQVCGTSRDISSTPFAKLQQLGIAQAVTTVGMPPTDFQAVQAVLKQAQPDEVYYLAGQSSVWQSFQQPQETLSSIVLGTANLLEAIRCSERPIKFYNAASSECFGALSQPANEQTSFQPCSPYGVAKAAAFWQVANYRHAYDLFACSGILFNHESPLRPERYVTRKIIAAACRIAAGSRERLQLGNLAIERDWGWAPEYVEAMWRMLQQGQAEDYVIATGETHRLEDFVRLAFAGLGLDWREHTDHDPALLRATDLTTSYADAAKAKRQLGWQARYKMPDVILRMLAAEQAEGRARCSTGTSCSSGIEGTGEARLPEA